VKKLIILSLILVSFSFIGLSSAFESKVLGDYKDYIQTFNTYLTQFEETGQIESVPSNQVEKAVYAIISEFDPAAYYRWIRMRSFQIPSGAVGNFQNIDMWYIAQNIYQRYKTNDETENVALASFLVYAVNTLYGKGVSQTDFPYFATFNQALFDLGTKVQGLGSDLTGAYLQKSLGATGEIVGTYAYKPIDLKKIFLSNLDKIYDGKIPAGLTEAIGKYNFKIQPIHLSQMNLYLSDLTLQALTQNDVNRAFSNFNDRISVAANNSMKSIKTFIATGQSTDAAVDKALSSFYSSLPVQEVLSANTVRSGVSKNFNNRIIRLEGSLAAESATSTPLIEWRWLLYALALIFFFFYKRKWLNYVLFAIIIFESLVALFGIDPMISTLDSTLYGFLVVTTAFFGFLYFLGIYKIKNIFQMVSIISVGVLFVLMLLVPLYSNLPSTRMSQNVDFMKSPYMGIYEGELYGQNGIITYDLQNISSDLTALRSDPYNFTSQTLSFYLSTLKKSGSYKGIVEYPNSVMVNIDRSSQYFSLSNLDNFQSSIGVVRDRAQAALDDIKARINSITRNENNLSNTLNGIYEFGSPALRNDIKKSVALQVSSSNLTELSTPIMTIVKKSSELPETAPNIQFFQTIDGSRLFIVVSFLFISVTFFKKRWFYRFILSIITIIAAVSILYQKVLEIFVEYGFPTYSHVLSSGERPDIFMIILTIAIGIMVAIEALYTRLISIREGKKV